MHNLDENPHSLRRYSKQAAKKQSKGEEPKKIACKMHGICTVTHLWIGIWRGMERNQLWLRIHTREAVERAVERGGTEKNSVQNARYLHGDPPVDRHLARDGTKSIVVKNPDSTTNRGLISRVGAIPTPTIQRRSQPIRRMVGATLALRSIAEGTCPEPPL